jgi:hypothetical protein
VGGDAAPLVCTQGDGGDWVATWGDWVVTQALAFEWESEMGDDVAPRVWMGEGGGGEMGGDVAPRV